MDLTPAPGSRRFDTTCWTLVLAAGGADTSQARQALDDLRRIYWSPLYAFVRRRGHSAADAQDLTDAGVLRTIVGRLQGDYAAAGKATLFDALKGILSGDVATASYAAIGERLGLSEGAVKVAAHRLRARYRERLRAEVARTVERAEQVDEELRFLLAAVVS